jgi:GWxTD domain-containing protein
MSAVFLLYSAIVLFCMPAELHSQECTQVFNEIVMCSNLDKFERKNYEGLRYLLNDFQKKHYLSLPTREERDDWLRRFWLMLDPTPASRKNERRIEHEERIEIARERYGIERFPGFDHRGETLIRFGEPDLIADIPAQLIDAETQMEQFDLKMPGEVWHYYKYKIMVPFEEVNLNGECIYYMELRTINRSMWQESLKGGFDIYNLEGLFFLNEMMTYSAMNLYELYFAATDEYMTFYSYLENNQCIYASDFERLPLEYYFDFTSFKNRSGEIRTDVNIEIPLRELTFQHELGKQYARFIMKIAVYDLAMNEVARATDIVKYQLPDMPNQDCSSLIPVQYTFFLDPGYYRFGLEVKDLKSNKHGCYRTCRFIEPLAGTLCISDIQFASSIKPADGETTFRRDSLRIVPHPLHAYRKPDRINFYFEIYGLDTDKDDVSFYSIEYAIEPKEKKRWGPVLQDIETIISSTFETSALGSDQHQRLEIDTDELWEGSFILRVRVRDRRTGKTAEKITNFSVLD